MRFFKLIGALIVALACSAVGVTTASAAEALWKWLPGSSGETFSGKSGKFLLILGSGAYTCSKTSVTLVNGSLLEEGSTEKKDATLALALISIEGCAWGGLPMNSVGDASGVILAHVEIHTCMIKPGHFGLIFKLLQIHLEIPSAKLLELARGAYIALFEGKAGTKAKTFALNIKAPGKTQELLKCEGGELQKLETAIDSEPFEGNALEEQEASITFDGTKDTAGEEPMEK